MASISVELAGSEYLSRLFVRAAEANQARPLAQAIYGEAQRVLNESKRIVPFRDGPLKRSGEVSKPKIDASGIEVEITYGGAAQAYAAVQHWDTSLNHANGKQALYLKTPVDAAQSVFVRNVAEKFATYLRRSA